MDVDDLAARVARIERRLALQFGQGWLAMSEDDLAEHRRACEKRFQELTVPTLDAAFAGMDAWVAGLSEAKRGTTR